MQNDGGTPRCIYSTYQRPIARRNNPSENASTVQTQARFPKSCVLADNRECVEKLCRSIAPGTCPTVPTIPRLPVSNRISFAGDRFTQCHKSSSRRSEQSLMDF